MTSRFYYGTRKLANALFLSGKRSLLKPVNPSCTSEPLWLYKVERLASKRQEKATCVQFMLRASFHSIISIAFCVTLFIRACTYMYIFNAQDLSSDKLFLFRKLAGNGKHKQSTKKRQRNSPCRFRQISRRHQSAEYDRAMNETGRKESRNDSKKRPEFTQCCTHVRLIFAFAAKCELLARIFAPCERMEWNRLSLVKRSENPSLIAFWYGLLADSAPRKWVSPGHPIFPIFHRSSSSLLTASHARKI